MQDETVNVYLDMPSLRHASHLILPVLVCSVACGTEAPSGEIEELPASTETMPVAPSNNDPVTQEPAETPENIPDPPPPPPTGMLTVSASSEDANVPANVLDGSYVTRWSSYGEGEWLLIDLGETVNLSAVDIAFFEGTLRESKFELLVGTDPDALTSVYSGNSSGTSYQLESFSFSEQAVRFIKIVGNGTTDGLWNGITEVRWAGFDPTEPVVIIEEEPPPPDEGGAPEIPADLLNLMVWKETLPIGSPGDPDEIEQPELNKYEHPEYFFVNSAGTGVVFRAHSGGVTTQNSGYPRSELREMTGSNGQSKADWSTSSGTHSMSLTGSITKVPLNKPHVVVAQIHDSNDDVVMVRFEGEEPGKTTTRGELFVESDGDFLGTLDSDYVLGELYSITIEATGGRIKVVHDGETKVDEAFNVDGCYFKAGCYSQSNTSNSSGDYDPDDASDFAEVVIYSLEVNHD